MARVLYSRRSKTNNQPQRVIAPRKAPRQTTKAAHSQLVKSANRITKSPRHSPMLTDGPSYYQGAEHYHGAVKFPPPRRNPPRTCRVLQAMQESKMSSYEPDHEFVSNYSKDSAMPSHEPEPQHEHGTNYYYSDPKHSEIVTEDEPNLMDLFDDDYPYHNYDSFGRFARELAQFKSKSGWKRSLKAAKVWRELEEYEDRDEEEELEDKRGSMALFWC